MMWRQIRYTIGPGRAAASSGKFFECCQIAYLGTAFLPPLLLAAETHFCEPPSYIPSATPPAIGKLYVCLSLPRPG